MKKFSLEEFDASGDSGGGTPISTDNISNPAYTPVANVRSRSLDLEENIEDVFGPGSVDTQSDMENLKLSTALSEGDETYGLKGAIDSLNELGFDMFNGDSSQDISIYGSSDSYKDLPNLQTPNSLASDIKMGYDTNPAKFINLGNISKKMSNKIITTENANIYDLSNRDSRFITLFDEYLDSNTPPVPYQNEVKPASFVLKIVNPDEYSELFNRFLKTKGNILLDASLNEESPQEIEFDFDGDLDSSDILDNNFNSDTFSFEGDTMGENNKRKKFFKKDLNESDVSLIEHIVNLIRDSKKLDREDDSYLNSLKALKIKLQQLKNSVGDDVVKSELDDVEDEKLKEVLEAVFDGSFEVEEALEKIEDIEDIFSDEVESESESMSESMKNKSKLKESLYPTLYVGQFYEVVDKRGKFLDFGMAQEVSSNSVKINGKQYTTSGHCFMANKAKGF